MDNMPEDDFWKLSLFTLDGFGSDILDIGEWS